MQQKKRKMWRLLKMTWLGFFNQPKVAASSSIRAALRDKAVVVARRVSLVEDSKSCKCCCPVCFEVICGKSVLDTQMILALHLCLWHHDEVQWQWEIMQKKKKEFLHLPSTVIGIGIGVGFGALLAFASKNHVSKDRRR